MKFDAFFIFTHTQKLQAIVDGFLLLQLHAAIGMVDDVCHDEVDGLHMPPEEEGKYKDATDGCP